MPEPIRLLVAVLFAVELVVHIGFVLSYMVVTLALSTTFVIRVRQPFLLLVDLAVNAVLTLIIGLRQISADTGGWKMPSLLMSAVSFVSVTTIYAVLLLRMVFLILLLDPPFRKKYSFLFGAWGLRNTITAVVLFSLGLWAVLVSFVKLCVHE